MRKLSFILLVLLSFAAFTERGYGAAGSKKGPNFIIIIADDVSWNDLGCYGHPHIRTPNLDRMAKEGMRFDLAFLTTSSCSPSRCSIMTGRYPHSTGAGELHQPLPANQVVFAGLLKRAGYYTASAGKWHLGNDARKNFDTVVGGRPSGCENWLKVLKERPKDRPFFLWLAGIDAHRPYSKNTIKQPHSPKEVILPPFIPDTKDTRRDFALYYDEITRLDRYVGEVLAELQRQGVDDNTIVIFMADNGRPFPRCKTTLYDSGIRTPFIVRWPRHITPGSTCKSLISSVDIAPTFIELASGIKQSPTFQGKSFAKLLTNPKLHTRKYVFAEHNWHDYQAHERAVRSERYLYLWNAFPKLAGTPPADAVRSPTYRDMIALEKSEKLKPHQRGTFITPRPKVEFYDLQKDPHCLKNLAKDESLSAIIATHRQQLEMWKKRTNDRVPENPTPDKYHREKGTRLKKRLVVG